MESFEQYLEQKRPWHAKKENVLRAWQAAQTGPIVMRPVSPFHKGTRFRSDGIRITGSYPFIMSVLARIKDLLGYENAPGTTLDVELRQVETKTAMPETGPAYVCYVYLEQK